MRGFAAVTLITRRAVAWMIAVASHAAERQAKLRGDADVLLVITGLEVGGAETLLLELCREDRRRGRTSSVASLMSEGPMRQRFTEIGVEVAGLGMRRGESVLPGLIRLVHFIRRRRPKIVRGWLYQGNLGATAATWLSGVTPRAKLAWSIHGAVPDFGCYPARLHRAVRLARLSPFVDGILYNGAVALDEHRGIGYRSRLSQLFSNGIDLAKFRREPGLRHATRRALSLPEDAVVVIAVGRDDPMKNWWGMLAAAEGRGRAGGMANRGRRWHRTTTRRITANPSRTA